MKIKIIVLTILISLCLGDLLADNQTETRLGIKVIAGGRYDDVRMCVGSAAQVKGGPIADVMLLLKKSLKPEIDLVFELPVMRPILFGAAFEMLQFEPQLSVEFDKLLNNSSSLILAPGVGVSLHYGPDYKSDLDNRGKDFFASGPIFSGLLGYSINRDNGKQIITGLRLFYTPLFSNDSSISSGHVLGAVLEAQFCL